MRFIHMDKIKELEKRIEDLEEMMKSLLKDNKAEPLNQNTSKLQKIMTEKISKVKPLDLVILVLHSNSKQSRDEMKIKFKSLGATKKMLNWFNGGNFKQRLIDTGIIFVDGKNDDDKTTYSLTEGKGKQKVLEMIENFESQN